MITSTLICFHNLQLYNKLAVSCFMEYSGRLIWHPFLPNQRCFITNNIKFYPNIAHLGLTTFVVWAMCVLMYTDCLRPKLSASVIGWAGSYEFQLTNHRQQTALVADTVHTALTHKILCTAWHSGDTAENNIPTIHRPDHSKHIMKENNQICILFIYFLLYCHGRAYL